MDLHKSIELYLNRKIDTSEYSLKEVGGILQFWEWNITDKPQPTIAQLEALQPFVFKDAFERDFITLSIGSYRRVPKGFTSALDSLLLLDKYVFGAGGLTEDLRKLVVFYPTPDFNNAEQCCESWLVDNKFNPPIMTLQQYNSFRQEFDFKMLAEQHKGV